MPTPIERLLQRHPHPFLTDVELKILLPGTANSRHSKVKRLLAQDKLKQIRRGLYSLTEEMGYLTKLHPFELAQYIYGPSYISLETALSFHRLIPEAVYTTTSVTSKRSKEFKTPLGIFFYHHLPIENFYTEVELIQETGYSFFMATPWKAICDYIFCYKKNWVSLQPLFENLRIPKENLPPLKNPESKLLDGYYQHKRMSLFLHGVKSQRNPR